jgi:hypothetical protein
MNRTTEKSLRKYLENAKKYCYVASIFLNPEQKNKTRKINQR